MIATLRVHTGYAVLAAIAVLVMAAIILTNHGSSSVVRTVAPKSVSLNETKLTGVARVIDGDTLDIRGTHVRLTGIDAPETKQTCVANEKEYRCGLEATEALIQLIGSKIVQCDQTDTDRNGRVIGRCTVDSIDIGGWMVEHGWAVAYRTFSFAYVNQENRAHEQRQGIWAGPFIIPEEWRRMKREGGRQ